MAITIKFLVDNWDYLEDFCKANHVDTSDCDGWNCPTYGEVYLKYLSESKNWTRFKKFVSEKKLKAK